MGKHLYTYINPPSERDIASACEVLASGGILAYPMEFNWALGCDASNVKALERIKRLKPTHPKDQPFSLICKDIAMAASVGIVEDAAYRILKKILPGPYTVLLPSSRNLPRQINDKRRVVGVRIPASPLILAVVAQFQKPLATASLPLLPQCETARFGYQVFEHFGHAIDLLLDLGDELPGFESTILDLTTGVPAVVRVGAGDVTLFVKDE